jgi:hypothetical protein
MKLAIGFLSVAAFAASATAALGPEPGSEWYGGDADLVNGLACEFNTNVTDAFLFDDFDHGNGTITHLYGDYFCDFHQSIVGFEWEIRSGVGPYNGGTLEASGSTDGTFTVTATGDSGFGFNVYRVVADITDVNLAPGTYHMSIAPVGQGFGRSFVTTTSGAQGVGSPLVNGNTYFYSNYFGANFTPSYDLWGVDYDVSFGVIVPAPGALALLGLAGLARRRRR